MSEEIGEVARKSLHGEGSGISEVTARVEWDGERCGAILQATDEASDLSTKHAEVRALYQGQVVMK